MQKKTIRFTQNQIAYLETVQQREGLPDLSSALRYIITLSQAVDEVETRTQAAIEAKAAIKAIAANQA
ncbi:hypothetical protein H6F90_21965 [Trichocoleus sp. FACHB-591]|uniref:hypothetical protein n=1 Tax=Trichocoleus sp. FACHB-591 TaxID=2692872 RepID=UPI001686FB2F|nr:hypothetical protein [Trichocoleus sp. FACHB-591]MBD2097743.1 hypothetical protein [Trichocoleus sp. FACHB-591]